MEEKSLVVLERAILILDQANTIQKAKEAKGLFLTVAEWARQRGSGKEVIQRAQSYALLAERKLGEMLAATERAKRAPGPGRGKVGHPAGPTFIAIPTLSALGLTKRESAEAQILASLPEDEFVEVQEGRKSKKAAINEERRKRKREEMKKRPIPSGEKKYRIIYADPPWPYDQWLPHQYGDVEKHYPNMSMEDLSALPIKNLAEKDSVLFLWATSPKLERAFEIIRAWGFEYKTSFVWDKVKHNFGYYNSVRHEFLLIAGKGQSTPDSKELVDSVVSIERSKKHSEKPAYFRNLIDKLYPIGNRIELFHRGKIKPGWDAWGNE
jgi:N6-adenosine-specific RNA methylase IME4